MQTNSSLPSKEELIDELVKRGASMEQIALLKEPACETPTDALAALKQGNARFFSSAPERTFVDANQRRSQIISQTPFAVILGCADSRVPVELIFDRGPGDLFSIRVAGNIVEPATLGSVEYAVRHLKVHLIVILGHEGCGAVAAAMLPQEDRDKEPLHIRFLLDQILPSVDGIAEIRDKKARMREAVVANVWHQVAELEKNPIVAEAIASGCVQVVGAFYEIGSGAVDFLERPHS